MKDTRPALNPAVQELADRLWQAQETLTPCARLSDDVKDLTVEDAYAIQELNIKRRLEKGLSGHPARVVGHKIGITSEAVQQWLQVDQPDFGHLLDEMAIDDAGEVPHGLLLQPRVEGEIAFLLDRPLRGPGVTAADVIRATDCVLPALEIIDSRIAEWKIGYVDTVADNASSGLYVVGGVPRRLEGLDLTLAGMALRKNGQVVSTGCGVACLGNPINAVVWLANTLGELGRTLEPGHLVLSGALGPVSPVAPGDVVELDVAHLGHTSVRFAPLPS